MDLSKRHEGEPLSEKEHQQRVNAARARWAVGAGAAGALIGGNIAFQRHILRTEPLQGEIRLSEARRRAEAEAQRRGSEKADRIRNAISARLRATRETPQQRFRRLYNEGGYAAARATEQGPLVIGNENHPTEVYDLQIDRHQRQGRSDKVLVDRLEAKDQASFDGNGEPLTAEERRLLLRTRESLIGHRNAIRQLNRFKEHAHARIVRNAHVRAGTEIPPVIARQYRRKGETLEQMEERRAAERTRLRSPNPRTTTRESKLLGLVRSGTERMVRTHGAAAVQREADTIRTELLAGRLRATSKGALIGAGLGFTIAGLGILAHHFATAVHKNRRTLAKAERTRAQDSIAAGLARAYREWIDRLLGRSEQPMNLGDDVGNAIVPGIAEAFAQGAANPPIDSTGSDPRWRIDVEFDRLNPAQRRHMQQYALDRIVQISEAQRDAIRSALLNQSVLQGIGPPEVARTIRTSIGLTPYQQSTVQSFRTQLENLDPAVFERKLRDKRYDRTIQAAIRSGTPLTDEQIDKMVDAYHRRALTLRAVTIARTEAIRATTQGALARAQEVLDQHPELDVVKIWRATEDDRTRPTHVELDGKEVTGIQTPFITAKGASIRWPVDEQAPADETINCFPAGVLIEGDVLAGLCAKYVGPLIEIVLRSGTRLPITPNHPVLTSEGMFPAGALNNGMHLLRYTPDLKRQILPAISSDNHDGPAKVEQVFHALCAHGAGTTFMARSRDDLHGDACGGNGDIQIAWANSHLLDDFMAQQAQAGRQIIFEPPSVSKASSSGQSSRNLNFGGIPHATSSLMGGNDLGSHLLGITAQPSPLQSLRIGSAAQCDASRYEPLTQRPTTDTEFISQLLQRGDGIATDQIIDIQVREFDGHVYDVQTRGGWTVANGIVCSNCRCYLEYRFVAKRGVLQAVAV